MTASIKWTLRAIAEAEDWIEWLAARNTKSAKTAGEELLFRTDRLARFNEMGRMGSVIGTRELSMPKWKKVLVYAIVNDQIEVISLRDTRRKPAF
jgi:plasmid stabilization system protein ParE